MNGENISSIEDPDGLVQLARELRASIETMIALYPPVFVEAEVKAYKGLIYVGGRSYFRREARELLKRLRAATYMQPYREAEALSTLYPHQVNA